MLPPFDGHFEMTPIAMELLGVSESSLQGVRSEFSKCSIDSDAMIATVLGLFVLQNAPTEMKDELKLVISKVSL